MDRPNVLLLYTDQQRWDALGCSGNPHIHTPNLDALARTGAVFGNAFANNPVCMPSRQSMLSGLYPSTLGCTCNGVEMPEDVPHVATLLKPYGYHAANLGKIHFLNHSNRDHREPHPSYGFDTMIVSDEPGCYDDPYIKWVAEHDPAQVPLCRVGAPPAYGGPPVEAPVRDPERPYLFEGAEERTHTAFVAEETAGYIRGRRGLGPWFAIAGFYAPHSPFIPPKRFLGMYDPEKLPPPAQVEGEPPHGGRPRDLADAKWREIKAYYYAYVSHVDDQVGRVLAALDDTGQRENTLVVFTSDHGEHLGDHGLLGKGPPGWDSCSRVPLIVSWPDRFAGEQRREEIVEAVDFLPTVLDCCGVQVPPFAQGRSYRALLSGGDYTPRESAFIEHKVPFTSSWKAVRTRDTLYAVGSIGRELLYDLDADPDQLDNLADDPAHAARLAAARRELIRRGFDVEDQYPLRTGAY